MRSFSWASRVTLGLALVAGSTALAKTTRVTFDYVFPGVNSSGNLDDELGADGIVTATYNDRNGKLRVVGRAVVENDSSRKQTFVDTGVLDGVDGDVVKDRYTVSKKGKATYNGLVRNSSGIDA